MIGALRLSVQWHKYIFSPIHLHMYLYTLLFLCSPIYNRAGCLNQVKRCLWLNDPHYYATSWIFGNEWKISVGAKICESFKHFGKEKWSVKKSLFGVLMVQWFSSNSLSSNHLKHKSQCSGRVGRLAGEVAIPGKY